jgi:NADPH2:quinone reductase
LLPTHCDHPSPQLDRTLDESATVMKAIQVAAFGGPEVLTLVDVERPAPKAGEVLVRVAAAGVNFMDIGQRAGRRAGQPLPFTPGGEASGIVESVGSGVTDVKPGDRVMYAMGSGGSYAEFVVVASTSLVPVPPEMDLVQAAAFPLQGFTAHYLLHDFRTVGPGTTVLVHAAAGGVGLLLTQYATHLGAHVIGTTSSQEKAAKATAMGARDVIVYTETNFADEVKKITGGKGVDLILDAVGKTTFPGDLEAVRSRGLIVVYGGASGQVEPFSPNVALSGRALTVSGASLTNFISTREEILRRAGDLLSGVRAGWLKLTIERVLPLEKAAEAHALLESRKTSGKLLLTP